MANINDPNPFNESQLYKDAMVSNFKSAIKNAFTNGVNNSKHLMTVAAANLGSKKARQRLRDEEFVRGFPAYFNYLKRSPNNPIGKYYAEQKADEERRKKNEDIMMRQFIMDHMKNRRKPQ